MFQGLFVSFLKRAKKTGTLNSISKYMGFPVKVGDAL